MVPRRREGRNQVASPREAFLWRHKSGFPVASCSSFVGHVDYWNLLSLGVVFVVFVIPSNGKINRITVLHSNAWSPTRSRVAPNRNVTRNGMTYCSCIGSGHDTGYLRKIDPFCLDSNI
jgi:hypothetical protein